MANLALVEVVQESHLATVDSVTLAKYGVDEAALAAKREECFGLTFDSPKNYTESSRVLASVRAARVGVKKTHKELKAGILSEGRRIDACEKYLTAKIEEIEIPLQAKKDAADEAKRAAKEAEEKAKRDAFEANLRAAQAAEQARIDAEREKLAREKAEFEAEKARQCEEQETERRKIEAEHRRLAEAREAEERRVAAEKAAAERVAKAKREAEEKAEREAREAEAARVRAQEQEAARLARIEALKPDAEKLLDYANRVTEAAVLEYAIQFDSEEADVAFADALGKILAVCNGLREFGR